MPGQDGIITPYEDYKCEWVFEVCHVEFTVQSSFVFGVRSYMQGWMSEQAEQL